MTIKELSVDIQVLRSTHWSDFLSEDCSQAKLQATIATGQAGPEHTGHIMCDYKHLRKCLYIPDSHKLPALLLLQPFWLKGNFSHLHVTQSTVQAPTMNKEKKIFAYSPVQLVVRCMLAYSKQTMTVSWH